VRPSAGRRKSKPPEQANLDEWEEYHDAVEDF
jgi:hypothetical protein